MDENDSLSECNKIPLDSGSGFGLYSGGLTCSIVLIGYEPAGLTVHLPPRMIESGSFFSYGCLAPPKIFSQKKGDFVGDIKR